MAGTTVGGVGVGLLVAAITLYQALVTRDQLQAALAQQRPWVRLDVEPSEDLTISDGRAAIPFSVKLTNVGALPATGLIVDTTVVAAKASPFGVNALTSDADISCGNTAYPDLGSTLFPGEAVTLPVTADASAVEMARVDDTQVGFIVRVCAQYFGGKGSGGRRTEKTIRMSRRWLGPGKLYGFVKAGDSVRPSDLNVEMSFTGHVAK